ncbi:MAG: hypothetical protein CVU06_00355 [Bacteroidetes bacterium HGW-Bacteroidetes-22]|nr:MAG: hypothetical protein CVU06_00355 [Bacteroidetes bacterium HGW-Bacteroidetes-22]
MQLEELDNHKLFAYCGLYCSSCSVYNLSQEDPSKLQAIANRLNQSIEETRCNGCRSDKVSLHCSSCELKDCAISRGINFCSECSDYPCDELKSFQSRMPHRAELFESLDFLKNHSLEEWEAKMVADFSCCDCGTINSPYNISCRKCAAIPGSPFIERNLEKIKQQLGILMK